MGVGMSDLLGKKLFIDGKEFVPAQPSTSGATGTSNMEHWGRQEALSILSWNVNGQTKIVGDRLFELHFQI